MLAEGSKFWVAPYTAEIGCVPTASAAVEREATPDEFSTADPSAVDPSKNTTVPATDACSPSAVAVNTTLWPEIAGFTELLILTAVVSGCTVTVTAFEVDPAC